MTPFMEAAVKQLDNEIYPPEVRVYLKLFIFFFVKVGSLNLDKCANKTVALDLFLFVSVFVIWEK